VVNKQALHCYPNLVYCVKQINQLTLHYLDHLSESMEIM